MDCSHFWRVGIKFLLTGFLFLPRIFLSTLREEGGRRKQENFAQVLTALLTYLNAVYRREQSGTHYYLLLFGCTSCELIS